MNPLFGTVIKGARIRFRWVDHKGCFIRMSPLDSECVRIELAPFNTNFTETGMSRKSKTPHYIWWKDLNDEEDMSILETIPCLRNLKSVKRELCFDVDMNGLLVK